MENIVIATTYSVVKPKVHDYGLYGLKINTETLRELNVKIEDVIKPFITEYAKEDWVLGLDEVLGKLEKPHYHFHFKASLKTGQTRQQLLAVLQKFKQKCMGKEYGRSTKIYCAKDKDENAEIYCWYGYACKENIIDTGNSVDRIELNKHAYTQRQFKLSKLNQLSKKIERAKQDIKLKDLIYAKLDERQFDKCKGVKYMMRELMISISEYAWCIEQKNVMKIKLEHYAMEYALKSGLISHEQKIEYFFGI